MNSGVDVRKFSEESRNCQASSDGEPSVPSAELSPNRSGLISKVLSPAIQLWLRSQVESVEELEVKIAGGDRQILSGYIAHVAIQAVAAVYQGLHLGQIYVTGTGIRINFGQILKGQPLRLLEPVAIAAQLQLSEANLNASLQSPLLANAVTEFLLPLLHRSGEIQMISPENSTEEAKSSLKDATSPEYLFSLAHLQITLNPERIILRGHLVSPTSQTTPFVLDTGLQLASYHELQFVNPCLQFPNVGSAVSLDSFQLDLGSEVAIAELTLSPSQLICRGCITLRT